MKYSDTILISCIVFIVNFQVTTLCNIQKLNLFKNKQTHIAALVLARGGSKGIRLKNLATINNKTLLAISLQQITKVKNFDSVWVSTDNDLIFNEVVKLNEGVNIHWRSEESATDTASSIFAINEFLSYRPEIDVIGLVQCTSPFIDQKYLQKAVELLENQEIDCVFSATKSFKLRWMRSYNENLIPINFNLTQRPRRQDWGGELIENGMLYFTKRRLLERGLLQNEKCAIVEIPEEHSLEIDSEYHLQLARFLQLKRK